MSFSNPSCAQLLKKGRRQSFLQFLNVFSTSAFPIWNHNFFLHSNSAVRSTKDRISFKDNLKEERHLKRTDSYHWEVKQFTLRSRNSEPIIMRGDAGGRGRTGGGRNPGVKGTANLREAGGRNWEK